MSDTGGNSPLGIGEATEDVGMTDLRAGIEGLRKEFAVELSSPKNNATSSPKSFARARGVSPGGSNVVLDTETAFKGMSLSMKQDNAISVEQLRRLHSQISSLVTTLSETQRRVAVLEEFIGTAGVNRMEARIAGLENRVADALDQHAKEAESLVQLEDFNMALQHCAKLEHHQTLVERTDYLEKFMTDSADIVKDHMAEFEEHKLNMETKLEEFEGLADKQSSDISDIGERIEATAEKQGEVEDRLASLSSQIERMRMQPHQTPLAPRVVIPMPTLPQINVQTAPPAPLQQVSGPTPSQVPMAAVQQVPSFGSTTIPTIPSSSPPLMCVRGPADMSPPRMRTGSYGCPPGAPGSDGWTSVQAPPLLGMSVPVSLPQPTPGPLLCPPDPGVDMFPRLRGVVPDPKN